MKNRFTSYLKLTILLGLMLMLTASFVSVTAQETGEIVYFSMFSEGEPLQQVLQQATEDFMAENPDIDVEIVWAGRQNLTQLQSVLAAGDQVDIVDHSDDRVFNAIVREGLALPLDDYLDTPAYGSDTPWGDTFVPAALDIGRSIEDGNLYLIARDDYISAFFYNVGLLEELEIEPETVGMTHEDFMAMLAAIQESGVSPLGADATISFYNNWYTTYFMIRAAGMEAFRDAAYDETGELWLQPEFLQGAQMITELQDAEYFQDDFEGSVWPAAQVHWVGGDVAMLLMGAWLPAEMGPQMPEGFSTQMFAFPVIEDGLGNDWVEHWANTYAILNTTESPDAAVLYLKYITSPAVVEQIVAIGVPMPIVGAPIPVGLENQYDILNASQAMPARAGLNTEIPEYMESVFNVCTDAFFQMQSDAEEFIACLADSSENYWSSRQ
jgi:raffinose/stachyose/melibiose transport system substrate-binding protein